MSHFQSRSVDCIDQWKDLQLYKMLRAVDYELIWNNRNYGMNAYGICPAANTRPMDWADYVAQEIQNKDIGIGYWLYGVGETPKGLKMVKYNDWGKNTDMIRRFNKLTEAESPALSGTDKFAYND